tara:strand:+ start:312 stop:764 length:453 start_codon:yes stop_codon:yes gene_type:complete
MIIKSLDHLNLISKKIADKLSENDLIYLTGEIGVGKTSLTRSLINYLQEKEGVKTTEVLSPTFNLLYEYEIKNYKIMHYDLYRIKEEKELINIGIFSEKQKAVRIIEWPQMIKNRFKEKLEIDLNYTNNENEREVSFKGIGKWSNFENEL